MLEEEFNNEEMVEEPAPVEEQQAAPANDDANKAALTAFILCVVALVLCSAWWIGCIASFILVLIARGKLAAAEKADKQPNITFYKIAKIAWWIILILAILAFIGWLVAFIVAIAAAIAAAAAEAGAAAVVLF